jgi:hypothetical protein
MDVTRIEALGRWTRRFLGRNKASPSDYAKGKGYTTPEALFEPWWQAPIWSHFDHVRYIGYDFQGMLLGLNL